MFIDVERILCHAGRAVEGGVVGKKRNAGWAEGIPKVKKGNRKVSQKLKRNTTIWPGTKSCCLATQKGLPMLTKLVAKSHPLL